MSDEFANRMGACKTSLTTPSNVENKTVWFNQPPVAFTAAVQNGRQSEQQTSGLWRERISG